MLPTAIIAPPQYECTFLNTTTQPVAVQYQQSQENTFHTTVVNHRWIEPGNLESFRFSVKDKFYVGYQSDEVFSSVGADLWRDGVLIPSSNASIEIYHGDDGYPHFREVIDAQR